MASIGMTLAPSISRAAVTSTTSMPANRFTRFTTSDEPTAAIAGTPLCSARTVIAPICQTLPGTYLPRLLTNQMRAASPHPMLAPQAMTVRRQVSINTA